MSRPRYAADQLLFRQFQWFCASQGLTPLPALPSTVASYLSHRHWQGRAYSTVLRDLSAIDAIHMLSGHPLPGGDVLVRHAMRGIRQASSSPRRGRRRTWAQLLDGATIAAVVLGCLRMCGNSATDGAELAYLLLQRRRNLSPVIPARAAEVAAASKVAEARTPAAQGTALVTLAELWLILDADTDAATIDILLTLTSDGSTPAEALEMAEALARLGRATDGG